jgi:dipeptidyl aminopeptidase/acylaminoacyl peptidase
MKLNVFVGLCVVVSWFPDASLQAVQPPQGSITIDRIADIKYPTEQSWSPDNKTVAFLWDAAGKQDLFMVRPGEKPVALTDFPINPSTWRSDIGHFEWISADQIAFSKEGGLWTVSTSGSKPSRLQGFEGVGNFALSRDKEQIAFIRRGQVWAASLKGKTERQLTHLEDGINVGGISFSPDNKYVSFTTAHIEDVADSLPYNGDRVRVFRTMSWGSRMGVISVYATAGDPTWISTGPAQGGGGGNFGGTQWVSGPAIVHQEFSSDRKTREVVVTDVVTGQTRLLWKDHDPAYWTPTGGARMAASPDGKWIEFVSDRTGWPHIYVTPYDATSESQAKQLSSGSFGDAYAAWKSDSKHIAYAHSAVGNQMERFISIVDITTGKSEPVVTARGVSFDPVFSPDGSMLAYSRAAVEHPLEVYAIAARAGAAPIRLTDSLPPEINVADLTAPVPVSFPSRADGKPVPATLIVSKSLDKAKKHPAIIWAHGSGSDQNYLGWHPGAYRMYYAMHQYLAQQGYVILTPDYRGSSGYSRDWAVGDYMDMGGGETKDMAAGADYLKTLSYVDPDRIGIWGLSYGGFMTLQAVTTTPTLFRCAIDVAGVGDWATWNSGAYTVGRLGTPVTNPEGFYTSAPVKHLDKLQRPLMILQGTNDTNVPFWETLTVIDALEKLGKSFDMALYPGEIHFFRRAYVLRDAWRRSEAFFDKYLKDPDNTIRSVQNNAPTSPSNSTAEPSPAELSVLNRQNESQ